MTHIIGNSELALDCTWTDHGGNVKCELDEEVNTIQCEKVELAPGR